MVVGASGALGGAVTAAFAAAGAAVTGLDRQEPAEDRRHPEAQYRAVDVLDEDSVGAAFDEGPPPWAVVNLVGGYAGFRPIADLDLGELTTQLTLNLHTAALITKHALRVMRAGRVVHTASRAGVRTQGQGFPYSVSKAGVLHLVSMAAAETHGTGLTVNAVVPSIMDTPANRAAMPDADHAKWPTVEQVARVYVWLASPDAELVSGAAVPVYGLS